MSDFETPQEIAPRIWTFPIPMPNNPLKWLNCYVIKGTDGKNLLIDTGFNQPVCQQALLAGMRSLSLVPEQTDVFITHLHSDHAGNANFLQQLGCKIIMGESEFQFLRNGQQHHWERELGRAVSEGIDMETVKFIAKCNESASYIAPPFEPHCVQNRTILEYSGYQLTCVSTPGHTPGHMCLYAAKEKFMFLGDHVLFNITPNIVDWYGERDSLSDYLNSLRKVREFDVDMSLPGHRTVAMHKTLCARVDELLAHHADRLNEATRVVQCKPGLTACEVAQRMSWNVCGGDWSQFTPSLRWFAFRETLAHLDHLVETGQIIRGSCNGAEFHYNPTSFDS